MSLQFWITEHTWKFHTVQGNKESVMKAKKKQTHVPMTYDTEIIIIMTCKISQFEVYKEIRQGIEVINSDNILSKKD